MIVGFDKFGHYEQPLLTLCNSYATARVGNTISDNGQVILSGAIGCLYDISDFEIVDNFGTTAELNFALTLVTNSGDAERDRESRRIYDALKAKRTVFVEGKGFFVIDSVVPAMKDLVYTKTVRALSCECELAGVALPYIQEDESIAFITLLNTVIDSTSNWQVGDIDGGFDENAMRFFDSTDVEDCYTFMMENMQDVFECVFEFDIIERKVNVFSKNDYVRATDIQLTASDFISEIKMTEESDDFATVIRVSGKDDIDITMVNPLGTNLIYNLDYYQSDMEQISTGENQTLWDKWSDWEDLVDSKRNAYTLNESNYQRVLSDLVAANGDLSKLNIQLEIFKTCLDAVITQSISDEKIQQYNAELSAIAGEDMWVGITADMTMNDAKAQLMSSIVDIESAISTQERENAALTGTPLDNIADVVSGSYHDGKIYETYDGQTYSGEIAPEEGVVCLVWGDPSNYHLVFVGNGTEWLQQAVISEQMCLSIRQAVNSMLSITNEDNFTEQEQKELSQFIYFGTYEDEYAIITDNMTFQERIDQYDGMFARAQEALKRVAVPLAKYDITVDNFVFVPEMHHFTEALRVGRLVWVEVFDGEYAQLFLNTIAVNYSDMSLELTFGNRYDKFDNKTLYEEALGSIAKSASTVQFLKDLTLPIRQNKLLDLDLQIQSIRSLAMSEALRSNTEEVVIDSGGYWGRSTETDGDKQFSDEQMRIVHNMILFTDDNWQTIKSVLGKMNVNGETMYGLNAEALIGKLIAGEKMVITNESQNFSVDENGVHIDFDDGIGITNIGNQDITDAVQYSNTASKHIEFTDGAMSIKDDNAKDSVKLSSDGLRLYGNINESEQHEWEDNEVAYIGKDALNISKVRVFDNLLFQRNEARGDESNYAWLVSPRTNGNLSFKWNGGNWSAGGDELDE